jgi:hypothetical protein
MNLKAAPFEIEIEFGLEPADGFEADVAERTDVVREHHYFERHRKAPMKDNIEPVMQSRNPLRVSDFPSVYTWVEGLGPADIVVAVLFSYECRVRRKCGAR